MGRKIAAIAAGLSAALASVMPFAALAQSVDVSRNQGVLDRPRPDYDAYGMRSGVFVFLPKITGTAVFDDNVFASTTGAKSDTIFVVRPELKVQSDWSRNMVEAFASAQINKYAKQSGEDTTDFQVGADGRLDVGVDANLTAGAQYGRFTESRSVASTSQGVLHPVRYDLSQFNFGGMKEFNRLRVLGGVRFSKFEYDNATDQLGNFLLEKDRNRNEWYESGRVEYAYSPDTALFVAGELNQVTYDLQPPASLYNRNANGYNAAIGARMDLTHLLRGELQVGYLNQSFDSNVFHDVSGVSVHGKVDFFVTPLTTVTATADRSVGSSADPRSSSYLTTNGSLEVDREFLRNVILTARAQYEKDDYKGIDRSDDQWRVRAGVNYLVNRTIAINAYYNHTDVNSSGAARIGNFKDNQFMISIVFQR